MGLVGDEVIQGIDLHMSFSSRSKDWRICRMLDEAAEAGLIMKERGHLWCSRSCDNASRSARVKTRLI